ncbi:NACHT domain-containing protein [Streptomyces odonnellii]|uniref:NACHT domain-containing protein n=1 Tax=Streptomyces odonnellii TaxID=1417980 RepID=UPI0018E324F9|nr:NACHT domain-containing protein [Streptomyces odonnellii]
MVGLAWTVFALLRVKLEDADTAGVLAVLPGIAGAVLGGWGVRVGVQGLRAQRTPGVIAEEIARIVLQTEGRQYKQLLRSGREAPHGRIDLAFTATSANFSGASVAGSLESVSSFYRQLNPGRLVVTGAPIAQANGAPRGDAGAGKTVLALRLLLDLARERKSADPVPIRLTASSWSGIEIRAWLVSYLVSDYGFSQRDALQVVAADLVFPIVDGLDEMESKDSVSYRSRSVGLIRAIERYETGGNHCRIVITCREAHYQKLVSADVQPRKVTHLSILPVNAARARQYLQERVANTPISSQRWSPVLTALGIAASPGQAPQLIPTLLAQALDTPWRLTLVATVFQERGSDGTYLRDPADLLQLAASGQLYEFLLDRFIGATTAGLEVDDLEAGEEVSSATIARIHQLDSKGTWKCLAIIARYLNSNSTAGIQRTFAGRPLSSTDIILHELWPACGLRLPRVLERVLMAALATVVGITLWLYFVSRRGFPIGSYFAISILGGLILTFLSAGKPWPLPQHVDLRWFRIRPHRRRLVRDIIITFGTSSAVAFGYGTFEWLTGTPFGQALKSSGVLGLVLGFVMSISETLREKILASRGRPVANPREIIRLDSLVLSLYAFTGFAVGCFLITNGESHPTWLPIVTLYGALLGFFFGAGQASLRYWIFLVCSPGKVPLRLGRFLESAYHAGILRISGTAWQFRHRELQDHLASRPLPPSHL